MDLIRKHQLCCNFLQFGHYTQQCASDWKCQECRMPHYMLLHSQFECDVVAKTAGRSKEPLPNKTDDSPASHSSHLSCPLCIGQRSSALMMMCQIVVVTSDGHVTRARALFDCTSSTVHRLSQNVWHCDYNCLTAIKRVACRRSAVFELMVDD